MALTGTHLGKILDAYGARGGQVASLDTLAAQANSAMLLGGMNTVNRCAGFLSQAIMESAYLRTTSEYGGAHTRYAPYYGRTFIQLTWESNYGGFGSWCKARGLVSDSQIFARNPSELSNVKWGWLGAVYYFTARRNWNGITSLVSLCDRGNILEISRAVNCGNPFVSYGPGGLDARTKLWNAARSIGVPIIPGTAKAAPAAAWPPFPLPAGQWFGVDDKTTRSHSGARVSDQNWIRAIQKKVGVAADGRFGPGTRNAVTQWQAKKKISQDGKVGPATWATMK